MSPFIANLSLAFRKVRKQLLPLACLLRAVAFGIVAAISMASAKADPITQTNVVPPILTNSPSAATNLVLETSTNSLNVDTNLDAAPQSGKETNGLSLSSFKIISERNIFNANRSPRSSGAKPATSDTPKPIKVDSFTLVGTLRSEKGTFAFFDGSNSDFQKVLKMEDSIGGYKIAGIENSAVKLEGKGKEVRLAMGMQMRRQNEGDWEISSVGDSNATGGSSATNNNTEPSSGAESDVLKRLMQQREQELNK